MSFDQGLFMNLFFYHFPFYYFIFLGDIYSAFAQKFELKRNLFLLQLMGNLPEEELERSSLAAKLNGFAAELCPPNVQKQINAKINDIMEKSWPVLRDI